MKKIFLFLLAILITSSLWAWDFKDELFYYTLCDNDSEYTVEISLIDKQYSGEIIIPNIVYNNNNSYRVVGIASNGFSSCTNLISVKIGNNVEYIKNRAFDGCIKLERITIGSGLATVGAIAFDDCSALKSITITANTLEEYCNGRTNYAMANNNSYVITDKASRTILINGTELKSFAFPSTIDTISSYLFYNCDGLTDVTIPNNVAHIADYAFAESDSIANIRNCDGVKTVGVSAFTQCNSLGSITFSNNLISIGHRAFANCNNLSIVDLGKSIQSIGNYAFENSRNIVKFVIGASVSSIGTSAFDNLTNIKSIILTSNTIDDYSKSIANYLLHKNGNYTRNVPRTLLINDTELKNFAFPSTIDTISSYLFYNCDGLTDVTIPNNVAHIADYAFAESDSIANIRNCDGVKTVGVSAFTQCNSLGSITFSNNLISIGHRAFANCNNLKELICNAITPPALGNNAFSTNVLSSVYIPCGTSDAYKASSWKSYCKNFVEPASEMTLIVQTADSIQGSVIVDQMPTCNNDTANFHAIPNPLYEFIGWSDGNTDNPRTLVLTQDTSLVAYFEIIYLQPDTVTLCYGETYQWHDKTYDASGVYIDTISSGVATLYLTILPQVEETTEEATICAGKTYTWQADGKVYAESGTYSVTLQDINGCDSIVILHLTVNPVATTEETIVACDSYEWNGQSYTQSGDYTYTTTATNGCDSIVTLHLTINKSEIGETEYVTICYGETYTWNGQTYSTEGEYSVTLSNTLGCDSIATLQLTIMPEAVTKTETVVVGSDELPYTWRGNTYSATGQYTDVEQYATVACDSAIYVLDLTVLTTGNYDEQSVTICETEAPYTWYGESYSVTGKYTYTEKYVGTDIDSIQHILNLTVNPTVYTEEHITACDSYEWNGQTYATTGAYTYTTVAANGCDSIVTLHLTINKSEHVEFSEVACDSYEWNGVVYTESGDYTYTTTTTAGCERVEVLHLTINKSERVEFTETACDSHEWNGVVYTESGDYTYNTTTADGCERIEVLHLTILPEAITDSEELALCPSELPYEWYGQSLTEEGTYSATEQYDGMECDSVIHELTLNVYVQTLPATVTLPIVRTGEAIDVTIPTAEIQAHIAAETWYAPNALVAWYILKNSDWTALSAEPVAAGTKQVVLKYAVETDCGNVESENMVIDVIPTGVENTNSPSPISNCQKILYEDHIYILRDGKIYSIMGQEL